MQKIIIMIRKFIDRDEELAFLERKYRESGPQMVVLYGRRRVGKTELIRAFGEGKPLLYHLADKRGTAANVALLARAAAAFFQDVPPAAEGFEDIFRYLVRRAAGQRLAVALDEFTYLVEKDPALPSVFQRIVDEVLRGSEVMLVLCGSSMEMMERGVLSAKSPLYGRRTGDWRVQPLPYRHAVQFFPKLPFAERLRTAMVFGGIPAHLALLDDGLPLMENARRHVLAKGEPLHGEVEILLKEELRDPSTYLRVLDALAPGSAKVVDIAHAAGVEAKDLPKYLGVLQRLGYVERRQPVDLVGRGKRSLYLLADPFFAFWFAFVLPHRSALELGDTGPAEEAIRRGLDAFLGRQFERVAAEALGLASLSPARLGNWWGHRRREGRREEVEIDLVGLDEAKREALFVECKWSDLAEAEARRVLARLREAASLVEWPRQRERYGLVARSVAGADRLRGEGFVVMDLKDIEGLFAAKESATEQRRTG
ncbi:MAG: ATP-binding protein [Elusimicrobia bacterium]|nr:ATP-binding protein [Elusimicrobiota bacterium]